MTNERLQQCGCTISAVNPPVAPPVGANGIQALPRIVFCPLHAAAPELLEALVPRSRYDALDADWLEARAQVKTIADKAVAEIERLEAENAALREQLAQATQERDALQKHVMDLNHDLDTAVKEMNEHG